MPPSHFNVRVYGLIINEKNELLVSDEYCANQFMTKFPGGGLEFGEGLIEGLKREFIEECNEEIEILSHFYTTDFFIQSVFGNGGQLISVYYRVAFKNRPNIKTVDVPFETLTPTKDAQVLLWIPLETLTIENLTWPVDQVVARMLMLTK
jgi:ADP-ribose pyrophosphatase YjhB (NUDIX family)